MKHPYPKLICLMLAGALSTLPAHAADPDEKTQGTELKSLNVKGKRKATRRDNEVTGLGKITKNADQLRKEQISGIRDLTRYDPSISVVEQGRGASSGYSMRGVDRNRVALIVDGLPQAQSYTVLDSKANGGAINEIEYENLRSIELSKGASSSEYGNGALGGAVGFRSKEADDIVANGKTWGADSKTAYTGKNRQWMQSLGVGVKTERWEGLLQYTHRKGRETAVHPDALVAKQSLVRLNAFADEYDLSRRSNPGDLKDSWFILTNECPNYAQDNHGCTPKARADLSEDDDKLRLRTNPPLTEAEQTAAAKQRHITETVSAKDYTGSKRIAPNPMDYRSSSWLLKGAWQLLPKHRIGVAGEHTAQRYDIRDMTLPAYYEPHEKKRNSLDNFKEGGKYIGNNPAAGITHNTEYIITNQYWSRTRYFDERHRKSRYGLFYEYRNPDKNSWADVLRLSFDRQNIGIASTYLLKHCAPYPSADRHCRVSTDKIWSATRSEQNDYREQHNLLHMQWDKELNTGSVKHRLRLNAGYDRFRSALLRGKYFDEHAHPRFEDVPPYHDATHYGSRDKPNVYTLDRVEHVRTENCDTTGREKGLRDCSPRLIKGGNAFIALRDNISFGNKADWGIGLRYDRHRFQSDDPWTSTGKYRNFSWNSGLTVKPTDRLALSYRISNGYRVPAFHELFGRRLPAADVRFQNYVGKFKAEKSLNQEAGIGIKGAFGQVEASYHHNRYKDLITIGKPLGIDGYDEFGYHNLQNITLGGINVVGRLDWNGISEKLPYGLYSNLAYSRIRAKKFGTRPNFSATTSPLLDTLQPDRYVFSLGYDHPEGKWGISATTTYSAAKSNRELVTTGYRPNGLEFEQKGTSRRSRSWYTHDLAGHYRLKNLTFRAGVYNLANRKYSTWESVRQSSINAVNPDGGKRNSASYAAPGRNFSVSLEAKF
ncbi:lactoferrin/transferrin family TonB-dependent receptor [Conchiformibius kuhniae]|uniref:Lactoferrin/transferrin family TonB-dependent receptor n=1 Tax=Conchiformibius kuhniae TaxID=211502 RepID=A0ABD8B6M9_9NEIS|nr:lactoferrin/transferrin family TonB-dependent receptor [Conchiformibius kuhniae]